ncbi:MAG: PfaD family polyunsaturated fatty acid/polyketide biosynthesis protein, partial [Proteobacteria bacterium]|nr:PfaD family polyunsaturated fatty acid/polyketide biosynthesis protein [Pseudomonadota bacterium]
ELARAGLLGFFGAGGLSHAEIEAAIGQIAAQVPSGASWGSNLLHHPMHPVREEKLVDLYLGQKVRYVSAAAYVGVTEALVRYRCHDIHEANGRVVTPNHLFAKVSRLEVAQKFLAPSPLVLLENLLEKGALNEEQVRLARNIPLAEDIIAEGNSGGHTDRQPTALLLGTLQQLRDRIAEGESYSTIPRVGCAGGIGTAATAWGAFAMGADFVTTGSINQTAVEAGTSDIVKAMLCEADFQDVAMGIAPDRFEMGATVQVLSRATMYAPRSQQLYRLYRDFPSLEAIDQPTKTKIERQIFRRPLSEVWEQARQYWVQKDPAMVEQAGHDPHHQMALTFRWYLTMSSRWARSGHEDRQRDFQIWCGPALGAFNAWAQEGPLETQQARRVVTMAEAIMNGATAHGRVAAARTMGLRLPRHVDAVPCTNWGHLA